jgi:hypothetical protein
LLGYLVVFAGRVLRICGLLYDMMMMMIVRQLPAYVVSAGGQRPVPDIPFFVQGRGASRTQVLLELDEKQTLG